MEEIHLALGSLPDVVVFRNHVGAGMVSHRGEKPVFERWGLFPGSYDLVCIVAPYGRWLCIEVKSQKGREAIAQAAFRLLMTRFGAVTGIARSVADALDLAEYARRPPPTTRLFADWKL